MMMTTTTVMMMNLTNEVIFSPRLEFQSSCYSAERLEHYCEVFQLRWCVALHEELILLFARVHWARVERGFVCDPQILEHLLSAKSADHWYQYRRRVGTNYQDLAWRENIYSRVASETKQKGRTAVISVRLVHILIANALSDFTD